MYSKYANYRFPSKVRLPENYSGNAFAAEEADKADNELSAEPLSDTVGIIEEAAAPPPETKKDTEEEKQVSLISHMGKKIKLPFFDLNIGKLFSGKFGFEELLLIALIFLLSQGDNDDGMILVLIFLLFVG